MKTLYRKYIPLKKWSKKKNFLLIDIFFNEREWALPLLVTIYKSVVRVKFLSIEFTVEEWSREVI